MKSLHLRQVLEIGLVAALLPLFTGCPLIMGGAYSSVERIFMTPQEEAMIAAAEEICPDFAAILSSEEIPPEWSEGECHLWYPGLENSEPLGITSTAIDFYLAQIEQLREDPPACRTEFNYRAECFRGGVTVGETLYENAYIVEMTMRWSVVCNPLNGWFFKERKTAIFSSEGEFVALIESPKQEFLI